MTPKTSRRPAPPKLKLLLLVCPLLASGAAAAGAGAWLPPPPTERRPAAGRAGAVLAARPVSQTGNAAQEEEAPPALPLTLRPAGFDEAELTAAPGEYLLVVSNRTGYPDLTLRLDQEGGVRLHEGALAAHERFWSRRVSLSSGAYVLSAGDDPAWVCRITVAPQ